MGGMPRTASTTAGDPRPRPDRDEAPGDLASRIDGEEVASVSFAATGDGSRPPRPSSRSMGHEGHARVGVGPGIPGATLLGGRGGLLGMNPFPIVGARIHPPLLRADTLSRPRLNDWLDEAATGRVALIVAEAGFGKTTFLGDWARHSSRLTAWYRLDPDDRDWLTFSRHLVASGRELDPEFAPDAYAMLMQLGPGGPTRADIQAALVREFAEWAAAHPQGLTLIFDDYHAVDGSDEVVPLVRALIDATGPEFSIVIASRSTPQLPLGRLRARGGVSKISTRALCFDVREASQLYRDAYRATIDDEVVEELIERTQGWPALLSLVNVGLGEHDTPDVRSVVAHLSATRGDLYDFLAEEVIASLDRGLHAFLVRVSVLTWVDVETARLVVEASTGSVTNAIHEAERLGLLSRPDRESPHRFHPLVRAFLQSQLIAQMGEPAVLRLHARVGYALQSRDWAVAAWHLRAAGQGDAAGRVIDAAIESILASGSIEQTRPFLDGSAGSPERTGALILRSRLELMRGQYGSATDLASRASAVATDSPLRAMALLNQSSILGNDGFEDDAAALAEQAVEAGLSPGQERIARGQIALWKAAREGPLDSIADEFVALARSQDEDGQPRYAGVTRLNLALIFLWLGRLSEAIEAAARAQIDLGGSAAATSEYLSAVAVEATACAYLGRNERSQELISAAINTPFHLRRNEVLIEAARLAAELGDLEVAVQHLARVDDSLSPGLSRLAMLSDGAIAIRQRDYERARGIAEGLQADPCRDIAGRLRSQLIRARVALRFGASDAFGEVLELRRLASAQRSRPGLKVAELLEALGAKGRLSQAIVHLSQSEMHLLSELADEIASSLDDLDADAMALVRAEAHSRPQRWAGALCPLVLPIPRSARAVALLGEVGGAAEARELRAEAVRDKSLRPTASAMARRLAPRVEIMDVGMVRLRIGDNVIGRRIRRKVLGLLCFLASRPMMAATRDETLDALWPDLDPAAAVNSLHQTIYFLRRLLETDYREGLSAGYVQFDGEVLTFDADLIDSSSRQSWRLLDRWRAGDASAIDALLTVYTGKFALDFAYEDWASAYREHLHSAVLGAIEERVEQLLDGAQADRAAHIAQGVLRIDPDADGMEILLLRAYRRGNRHVAAAEQYAHYATVMREQLGIEPLPLDEL
jgi:ATP/maltotriose-dependent transcriptional regulator MalT/DNA-binding SARP family transcriptional activator